jgi:hypothetical protein
MAASFPCCRGDFIIMIGMIKTASREIVGNSWTEKITGLRRTRVIYAHIPSFMHIHSGFLCGNYKTHFVYVSMI